MSDPCIDISEEDGVRYLHFGSEWVQGAMRLRRPVDLELEYTRDMMAGLLLREGFSAEAKWPKRILLIGLGAGSLTKFCYWKLPQARVTTVEISEEVWTAASALFKLPPEDLRLSIVIGDGVEYMQRPSPKYDYILVDGYDEDAKVGLLDSLPFYQACWARLNDGGILATNLFGRAQKYAAPLKRLGEAFEGRSLALPPCASGNVVALATRGVPVALSGEELKARAVQLKASTGLDLRPLLKRLPAGAGLQL
ncbi:MULTISPECIES: spermidine synthase [unclassified Uliginosibacterium]|uniref:spermine/spermidine synthase domain-containing protein n=1 Tax=unclassified Uliginosibacterium TaxID=2621521 RepID=UPI000C7D7720|nr:MULTISPECIES: spermidine synthase [unclassified Uliginosibacterium]MDO6385786.1 spermidine synthase [Uliginosibacterium sp. 31-12]PLK49802.1 spermidine synthase [Uliginosibacterium sp. TH139]